MPDETPEEKAAREAAEAATKKKDDDTLGEGGKAALDAERAARKQAQKDAAAQKKRADDLEAEKLSDKEKLEARAKKGDELAATATEKLRKANALLALSGKGLDGPKAKAAYRLLDGLEFGDDDEPTNLDARITAAKAEFSDAFPKAATADPPKNNGEPDPAKNNGGNNKDENHAGARPDAKALEEEAQMLDAYVKRSFPGLAPSDREGAPA